MNSKKSQRLSAEQEQQLRIQWLKEQIDLGVSPYQAFFNATEQKKFNLADAQHFRISLIKEIERYTKRRLIVYEAHLSKGAQLGINMLNDEDKIGFCSLTHSLSPKEKEVDVLVNSPGGRAEVVEELVYILRKQFDNIRFIIPDRAKSAATMLVLSGNCLLMDERSELGPIDPQVQILTPAGFTYVPAYTIIQGFDKAKEEIQKDPNVFLAYDSMLRKYDLHTFEICRNATLLAKTLVSSWLSEYMFRGQDHASDKAEYVAEQLCNPELLSHGRPITIDKCRDDFGLSIVDLRDDVKLREKIWILHSAYYFHLEKAAVKIYENSAGTSWHEQVITKPILPMPTQQKKQTESPPKQQE